MENGRRRHSKPARLAVATLVLLLCACGGGSGGAGPTPQPATIAASNDAASVAWNAPATIDVVANDAASSGALTVSSVSAPTHGQASVLQGKVVYVPTAGYYGPDSLTYIVRSDTGGATATATLALEVVAHLQISGTVTDAPIGNALVTVNVGSEAQTVTADAQGRYVASVRSSRATDFVRVDAAGVGAQQHVTLRSLVGEFGRLVTLASGQTSLGAGQLSALDVTHYSTAFAALASARNGGAPPATEGALTAARAQVSLQAWLDMAALLKRVIDGGVALPAGRADTLSLVGDASTYNAFLRQTVASDRPAFQAAYDATVAGLPTVAPAPPALGAAQTMVYYTASELVVPAYVVEFRPDGSAMVLSDAGLRPARWSRDAHRIAVIYDQAVQRITFDTQLDPQTGQWSEVLASESGLILRQATGFGDVVAVTVPTTWTYRDGSRTGQTVVRVTSSDIGPRMRSIDMAQRLPVSPVEFGVGSTWAGFFSADSRNSEGNFQPDVIELVGASQARSLSTGATYTFSVADNAVQSSSPIVPVRNVRVAVDAATGAEVWVAIIRSGGVEAAYSFRVFRQTALPVLPQTELARSWRPFAAWWGSEFIVQLNGDGSGSDISAEVTSAITWSVASSGEVTMSRRVAVGTPSSRTRVRSWTPMSQKTAGTLVVWERLLDVPDSSPTVPTLLQQKLRHLEDLGPALR